MGACLCKSSDDSLVDALAQFVIGGQSQDFINTLPNELLRAILSRVQVLQVIPLRSVSNRWNALILDICRQKKCLVIMKDREKDYLSELLKQFNFKLNKDFVFIKAPYNERFFAIHLSGQLCFHLPELFPNIEQFYVVYHFTYSSSAFSSMLRQWSSSLTSLSVSLPSTEDVNYLCARINRLTNLKQLHFDSLPVLTNQLAPTLARLEHFSGWGYESIDMIAPYFGEGFSSLGSTNRTVPIEELTKWYNVNTKSVLNLVRFGLYINNPQIFSFICDHFSSLQMLHVSLSSDIQFTTNMMKQLARLTHLNDLQIKFLRIDLASLEVANLRPLRKIRVLSLEDFSVVDVFDYNLPKDAARFCRLLSTIFPNVENLTIKKRDYPQFGILLKPHLKLFGNLRSHDFGLKEYDGNFTLSNKRK